MLRTALPVTLELSLLAIAIATVLGVGAGVVAAVRRGPPGRVGWPTPWRCSGCRCRTSGSA